MSAQQLPKHAVFQELGVSFDIPDGWLGQLDGDYILMGSHTQTGLMIAFENTSTSAIELKRLAEQGFDIKGAYLNPVGDISIKSPKRVEGMYQGMFNNNLVKCYAIGLINELGSGITIMILAKSDVFTNVQKEAANKLAGSVQFFKSKDSKLTIRWKNMLVGKQLKFMSTAGGYDINGGGSSTFRDVTIDLCANGQFAYYSNLNISFDTGEPGMDSGDTEVYRGSGYSDNTNNSKGIYKIYSYGNETILELTFDNGDEYEYDLFYESEEVVLLNETKYFIITSEQCN